MIDSRAPGSKQSATHREVIIKLIDIYNLMLNRTLPVTWAELSTPGAETATWLFASGPRWMPVYIQIKRRLPHWRGVFQVIKANLNTSYYPADRYRGELHMINARRGTAQQENIIMLCGLHMRND
ncbi:hypothetical protein CWS02_04370 [Enterobacter sp. EA-1]|nr:hypothetical protein CWS02_04370 [Enterobacter sp. EA-1]